MTLNLPFEKIKQIPMNHKHAVFGFIRQCQSMLKSHETYYQIPKSIQFAILLFYFSSIDSKILTDKEIDKLISLFAEQNKFKELEPYSYHLLYASYKDGIGEDIFKKICHDQQNLLCLIETKAGNVWGGYTSKGWRGTPAHETQDDDKAFLYVIRSKDNYPPRIFNVIHAYAALYNQKGYYCMFRESWCFYIKNDGKHGMCDSRASSSYQTKYYEPEPSDYYITGGSSFRIECVEVFQLK